MTIFDSAGDFLHTNEENSVSVDNSQYFAGQFLESELSDVNILVSCLVVSGLGESSTAHEGAMGL